MKLHGTDYTMVGCRHLRTDITAIMQGIVSLGSKLSDGLFRQIIQNASDRGIRKLKIKLKNSECFRSDLGADAFFMDLYSIIKTTKK